MSSFISLTFRRYFEVPLGLEYWRTREKHILRFDLILPSS